MQKWLISIIGSGRVGSVIAQRLVTEEVVDDLTLIDIIEGLPQGEALDLGQMATHLDSDAHVKGSNDFSAISGSDLIIVPAGLARKPGMTRMDLLQKNSVIIKDIAEKIVRYAPSAKVLMITNPLDVMTYLTLKVTQFPKNRVFGMGGLLDISRFKYALADAMGVSKGSVEALVIGEHGESMVPLPRYSSVCGIPVSEILGPDEARKAIETTRRIAAEVIALKGATIYAPAESVVKMVRAIVHDKKSVFPVSAYLEGEYGVTDLCIGVPAVMGGDGVERVIELRLNEEERQAFMKGVQTIRGATAEIMPLLERGRVSFTSA